MLTEYRNELRGVVALPATMSYTILEHARRIRVVIEEEQRKPNPDNALIALLCDSARLGDEFLACMRGEDKVEVEEARTSHEEGKNAPTEEAKPGT